MRLLTYTLLSFILMFNAMASSKMLSANFDIHRGLARPVFGSQKRLADDVYTLNLIKFIYAARKALVQDLLQMRSELQLMQEALVPGKRFNKPYPKEIHRIFPPAEFSDFYQEVSDYRSSSAQLYENDFASGWIENVIQKSIELTLSDIEIFKWKYTDFPTEEFARDKTKPDQNKRNEQLKLLEAQRAQILNEEQDRFLLLPIYKNLTHKGGSEFFFFHNLPNYHFYQFVVASIFKQEGKNFRYSYLKQTTNGHKKRTLKNNIVPNPEKLATWINLPRWDNVDRSDRRFYATLKSLPIFAGEVKENLRRSYSWQAKTHIRSLLVNLLDREVDNIDAGMELFYKQAKLKGASSLGFGGRSYFYKNNVEFFKHYSFLYHMTHLEKEIMHNYSDVYKPFNVFQLKQFHEDLRSFAIEDEKERSSNWVSTTFYGLGIVAMFIPYGQFVSPALFAAGASYSIGVKAIPNSVLALRKKRLFQSTYNSFEVGLEETALSSLEELNAHNMLYQNAKFDLALALGIELPLLLVPAGGKLVKSFMKQPWKNPAKMKQLWVESYQKSFEEFTGTAAKNMRKWQMTKEVLRRIVTDTNVQVATFYFAGIFALQAYFDSMDYGYGKDWEDMKPPQASDALVQSSSLEVMNNKKQMILNDLKKVGELFKHKDKEAFVSHMRDFYSAPKKLDQDSWFQLHDGQGVVKLFDKVFFPRSLYLDLLKEGEKQRASKMASAIAEAYLFQTLVESQALSALFQVNSVEFMSHFLNSDTPMGDFRVQFYGNNMMILYNSSLMLNIPMNIDKDRLKELAEQWGGIYKEAS